MVMGFGSIYRKKKSVPWFTEKVPYFVTGVWGKIPSAGMDQT